MKRNRLLIGLTLGAVTGLAAMPAVQADSGFDTGAGALSASADLNFRIRIPRFLFFRVGSTGATVDTVLFDFEAFPPTAIGDGTELQATGGTGDVTVVLSTNVNGTVTIDATTDGPLVKTGGGTPISFDEINTTVVAGTIPAPLLTDGATVTPPTFPTGGVVALTGTWRYSYLNNNAPEEGTYGVGGGGAGGGTVTYTASLP